MDRLYLNQIGAGSYPEQRSLPTAPRPKVADGGGDNETVKRYRQFFETHDLSGSPQRDKRAAQR
jgi:hypothetical protein